MPGEQALQIARAAIKRLIHENFGQSDDARNVARTALAALAAEGSEEQGSARSLPSWRIEAPSSTWRTIESAPKDGTEVLVCVLAFNKGPDYRQIVAAWDEVWRDGDGGGPIHPPTHRMPLPEPPAPVMAALGAATKAGSGMGETSPDPILGEVVKGLEALEIRLQGLAKRAGDNGIGDQTHYGDVAVDVRALLSLLQARGGR